MHSEPCLIIFDNNAKVQAKSEQDQRYSDKKLRYGIRNEKLNHCDHQESHTSARR